MHQFFCVSRKPNRSFHFQSVSLDAAIDACEKRGIPRTDWEQVSDPQPHAPIATAENWKLYQTEIQKSYWNTIKHFCHKKAEREREERQARKRQERFDGLRRKYQDVPLHWAVIQLFWREARLTVSDIAEILETDEDTVRFEIDIARQNAR